MGDSLRRQIIAPGRNVRTAFFEFTQHSAVAATKIADRGCLRIHIQKIKDVIERAQKALSMSRLVDVVRYFAVTVKSFIVKLRLIKKFMYCHANILALDAQAIPDASRSTGIYGID